MTCPKANAISIPGLMSPVSTPASLYHFLSFHAQMFPLLPSRYPFCVTLQGLHAVPVPEETVQACNRSWGNYYPFKIDTPAKQAAERNTPNKQANNYDINHINTLSILIHGNCSPQISSIGSAEVTAIAAPPPLCLYLDLSTL
ncbi:hypothetical protein ALC57_09233 [Trachymyrmex cornetzi]|uniref:Uncharacterized protein n=1 Tax=Trachymyrmex cornetzi TaxID=471704 RepID=A0A195E0A6_9HYME|nr:hypothetical protein ALC57_09233 [Trachymyrmex cornetzi]